MITDFHPLKRCNVNLSHKLSELGFVDLRKFVFGKNAYAGNV